MPAFKVRAKMAGEYNGVMYEPGKEFFLIDRKDPDTGEVIQTAEEAFAKFRDKANGAFGWMERVGAPTSSETPEQRMAREANEAQRKADMILMLGKGQNPDDPTQMLNRDGTGLVDKIGGGMGWDATGKDPNDNEGAGITLSKLLDAGYTEDEAKKLLAENVQKGQPQLAQPQAAVPRSAPAPVAGKGRASGAARAAVGAPPAPAPAPEAPAQEPSQSAAEVI